MDKSQMTEGQEYTGGKDGGFIVADDDAAMSTLRGIRKSGIGTFDQTDAPTRPMTLADASIGQVNIPPAKAAPIDFRGLKASLADACKGSIAKARHAEIEYRNFVRSIDDLAGPVMAIEKLKKEMALSESAEQIRDVLSRIAQLSVAGPEVTMATTRIFRRKWLDSVLPELREVVADVKARLEVWEQDLGVEKEALLARFGHLGIRNGLEADQTVGAMRRDVAHFEKLILEAENDQFRSAPGLSILTNWLSY